jgi:hypothetical protein
LRNAKSRRLKAFGLQLYAFSFFQGIGVWVIFC